MEIAKKKLEDLITAAEKLLKLIVNLKKIYLEKLETLMR